MKKINTKEVNKLVDDLFLTTNIENIFKECIYEEESEMKKNETNTRLLNKHFSPAIIRKYNTLGFPLYIHIICDQDLSDLDQLVNEFIEQVKLDDNNIQEFRDFAGSLSQTIIQHYNEKKPGCVESVGVIFYADKMMVSSLFGDVMNHAQCRNELYQSLMIMTQI